MPLQTRRGPLSGGVPRLVAARGASSRSLSLTGALHCSAQRQNPATPPGIAGHTTSPRVRASCSPRHGAPASTPAVTASTGAARNACERHHRCTIPPHTPDRYIGIAQNKAYLKRYRRPYAPAVAASAASSSSAGTKPQAPSCGQPQSSKRCWHGCRVRRPHDLQRARWQKGGTVRHQGFARGHPPHY